MTPVQVRSLRLRGSAGLRPAVCRAVLSTGNNDNDYHNETDDDDDNDDQVPGEGVCRELEACVHCQAFDSSPEHCRDCNFVLDFLENDFIEESSHQFESDSPCVVKTSIDCKYKYSGITEQLTKVQCCQHLYISVKLNVTNVWVVLHTFGGTR